MQVTDKLGGPFTPPGFYYKTFIRPRRLWPLYEKFLRGAAGLGQLDPNGSRQERVDVENRHVDVARDRRRPGRASRRRSRPPQGGESVVVVDEGYDVGGALLADRDGIGAAARASRGAPSTAGVELLAPAIAIGLFEQGLVPVAVRQPAAQVPRAPRRRRERDRRAAARLPRQRPRRRDAAGRRAPARQRLLDQAGRACRRAHGRRPRPRRPPPISRPPASRSPRVVDFRDDGSRRDRGAGRRAARSRRSRSTAATSRPTSSSCPAARSRTTSCSRRRARASSTTRAAASSSRPTCLRTSRRSAPSTGDVGEPAVPSPMLDHRGDKCFVCFCEDQTTKDLKYAIARGLRLDRALEALHDGDDGAVPGPALPHELDPRLREDDRARREHDRHDDGPAAVHAGLDGAARGPAAGAAQAHVAPPPPQGHGRDDDVDGRLAAAALLRRRRRRRGAARAPRARADRRLDARQDPRHRPRRRRVPRPRLPEPLLRPRRSAARATACSRATPAGSWTTASWRGSTTRPSTCRRPRPAPTASTSGSRGGTRSGSWTSSSRT